jgi:hypothetical protein
MRLRGGFSKVSADSGPLNRQTSEAVGCWMQILSDSLVLIGVPKNSKFEPIRCQLGRS